MDDSKRMQFEELPPDEQHTVQTWIDELSRRDTVVDAVVRAYEGDAERPSQVYSIPSAEGDWRSAEAIRRMAH